MPKPLDKNFNAEQRESTLLQWRKECGVLALTQIIS
jgi:hypothetical protein